MAERVSTSAMANQPPYSGARTSTEGMRQGWLKSLESAGLQDALRGVRVFPGSSFSASALAMDQEAAVQLPHRSLPQGMTPQPAADDLVAAPLSTQGGEHHQESPMPFPSAKEIQDTQPTLPAGPSPLVRPGMGVRGEILSLESLPASAWTTLQADWQAHHTLVLSAAGGAEVWVRDARLKESDLLRLLADFRGSMAELGCSLVRLSLNGKLMYSRLPAHGGPEQQQPFGEK